MKLVILGATGPSGQELVDESLEQGHEVVALVRSPEKLCKTHDRLKVQKVDIFNEDDLVGPMKGADAVLSCLGCRPSYFNWSRISFYTDSIIPIVSAMKKADVRRLICITSWYTVYKPEHPFIIEWIIKPLILGGNLSSMSEMEEYLSTEISYIDFTCVRPPQLTSDPTCGMTIKAQEGQFIPNAIRRMPRRDLAKFMLSCLQTEQWKNKNVAIAF